MSKIVVVIQHEVIRRMFALEVPEDKTEEEIEEAFFEEDIGGSGQHFKEDYEVDLLVVEPGDVRYLQPPADAVCELFDEETENE